jgi:S-layer protein
MLTTGVDTGALFTGGAGNDTFTAGQTTTPIADGAGGVVNSNIGHFSALDNLDGGSGSDTLNIIQTTAFVDVPSAVVKNIETANITSALDVNVNTMAWTGLTQLNVTSSAAGAEVITAATTTGVTIANSTAFGVTVVGGGLVGSVSTGAAAIKIGDAVAAAGDANAFTSVSTKGGTTVDVTDNSGTTGAIGTKLTAVTVDGAAGAVTLTGNAVADVTIKNGVAATAVTVTNAAVAAQTLNVTLDTSAAGASVISMSAKTVNVSATGAKASTIDLDIAAATALTTAGAADLTLATTANDYTALKTVTVNNTGKFSADLSGAAALTAIVATASTGANTVTVDATKATYAGGSGVDTITIAAAPTKSINGGAGTADVLVVDIATAFNASANTKILGFETLALGTSAGAVDYDATGFANLTTGNTAGASSFTNVAPGTSLTFTAANANIIGYSLADSTGLVDSMTVNQALAASGANLLTATGVETININATNTTAATAGATAIVNTLTLSAAPTTGATTKINVTSGALTGVELLNTTDLTISTVNASGVQGDGEGTAGTGFEFISGILAATTAATTITVTGSANGGDIIDLTAALSLVVINGAASGVNTLTGSSANKSTITGGTGADTIIGGDLADTIVGGGGADVITAGAGADKITISGTTSELVNAALGDSGANTATTIQTAQLTSTFDVVTGLTAGTTFQLFTFTPGLTATNSANLAGADNLVVFARGAYDSAAGTFTYAANGADTAMTYDTDTTALTAFETVVLVGFVQGATTAIDGAGLITFA